MVGRSGKFLIASAVIIALVALVLLSGLVKATKIIDTATGQVVGETFAFGDCRYVGQDKLICPGESPDSVQACLEGVTVDASCDADCVLQNTQECVSGLSGVTLAGGPSTTGKVFGVLLPPGSSAGDCIAADDISRMIATKDSTSGLGDLQFVNDPDNANCGPKDLTNELWRLHDAVLVAGRKTIASSGSAAEVGWSPEVTVPSSGEWWTSPFTVEGFCTVKQNASSGEWYVDPAGDRAFCIYDTGY